MNVSALAPSLGAYCGIIKLIDPDPHPLLVQVPLTVSPFVSLPTATTLPYTYKTLPSTLPPSATDPPSSTSNHTTDFDGNKPRYVISSTGHAAHPEDIIASCQSLQAHLKKLQAGSEQTLEKWKQNIKERELAEKRRLAPGWLDRDEKILKPEKAGLTSPVEHNTSARSSKGLNLPSAADTSQTENPRDDDERGQELDRAFGGMVMR